MAKTLNQPLERTDDFLESFSVFAPYEKKLWEKIVTLHFQTFFGEGNKYQLWPKVQKCRNNFVFSFFVKLINVREKLDSVC